MALRPERFVPRHQLDELVSLLCTVAARPAGGTSVAITTALRGAGGFGKTTLAQALCHDEHIQRAYPDGILWVTLGEQPSDEQLLGHVFDLIRWAGSEPTAYSDVDKASAELRELLANRRVLLVVDDVWRSGDLAPFYHLGAAVLVTTRDRQMLPVGCPAIEVDAMAGNESSALLGCQLEADDGAAPALAELAARLGRWPLLLDLVNRQLRELAADGMSLGEAITDVMRLLDEEGLTAFDLDDDEARRTAVARTMAASLRRLSAEDRQRYEMLAVFPEAVDIPLGALTRYWGVHEGEARKLCERLHGRSMLQQFNRAMRTIGLHDVFRRYLIDKQDNGMPALHRRWLDAFRPRGGRWIDLPQHERHAWQYLAYHLRGAGEIETLRGLLLDYHWLDGRLRAVELDPQPAGGPGHGAGGRNEAADVQANDRRGALGELIGDFAYADDREDAGMVRDALRLSSHVLARDPDQLPSQFVGRLGWLENEHAPIRELLAQIRSASSCSWLCPVVPTLTPPGGPLLRILSGHTAAAVWAVAVTPDGTRAVSASTNGILKIWDLENGAELHSLDSTSSRINALAVAPDCRWAVSGSDDGKLKVWDLENGKELNVFPAHSYSRFPSVFGVAVTRDGKRVVSASEDRTLKVWDVEKNIELCTLAGHEQWVKAVAVTPDGKRAISASNDKTLKVWDLDTGIELRTLAGHSDCVAGVAITVDGQYAVSASWDNKLIIWHIESGAILHKLAGHSAWIRAVAVHGMRAVSASNDHTLMVWDVEHGTKLGTLRGHSDYVSAVVAIPNSSRIVSGSGDGTLKVWDLKSSSEMSLRTGHSNWVWSVVVTPDGARAISASQDKTLKVWDLQSGATLHTLAGHADSVNAVAVDGAGTRAISASDDATLKVWDLHSGMVRLTLAGHSGMVNAVAVSADGMRAVSASDKMLKVWSLDSGAELHTLAGHLAHVVSVTMSADGTRAVSASRDRIVVWDLDSGAELHTLTGHSDPIRAVAVSEAGTRAVSADDHGILKIWNTESGAEMHMLAGHSDSVTAVAVSADGKRAASASWDRTVRVWDLDSGAALHTLTGHSDRVNGVAVSADGKRAVSVSEDHTCKVWDIDRGKLLATFSGESPILACAIQRGGDCMVAGDQLGHVHVLRLIEPGARPAAALPAAPAHSSQPSVAILSTADPGAPMSPRMNDQPWHTPLPRFDSVSRDEFLRYAAHAPVLLVVATKIEREAVCRLMQPIASDPASRRLKGHVGQQTYYCGTFGAHRAVLTTCEMGSIGRDAAILSIQQAISDVSPGCVIMVGIAFGKDPAKQHIGQVLVASQIISYEQQRVGGEIVQRGPRVESDGILKNRFRNLDNWHFELPDGRACAHDIGPMLSGEKLIDDSAFKVRLFAAFPDAIGGEMEGVGLYAAASRTRVPWILVKAICDWADGTKTDGAQPLAAAAATSLVHAMLSDPHVLDGIHEAQPAAPAAVPPLLGQGRPLPAGFLDAFHQELDEMAKIARAVLRAGEEDLDPVRLEWETEVWSRQRRDLEGRLGAHACWTDISVVFELWNKLRDKWQQKPTSQVEKLEYVQDECIPLAKDILDRLERLRPLLARTLIVPARDKATAAQAADGRIENLDELVVRLLECEAMRDSARRALVVERLDRDIRVRIVDAREPLVHVTNIVNTCSAFSGGLSALHRALHHVEGPTTAMQRVNELFARQPWG